jgi:hypothetical protein
MRKISRKKLLLLAGVLSLAVIFVAVFWHWLTGNPAGRYIDDKISYTGLSYIEFTDGKVYMVLSEGYDRYGGREALRDMLATYSHREGKWMVSPAHDDEPFVLDVGLFSIRWKDAHGNVVYEIPRMWTIGGKVIRLHRLKI